MKPIDNIKRQTEDLLASIGARVRSERLAKKISRVVLSERSQVSTRYLAQLESGTGNISIGLLYRVARAMDLNIQDLLISPQHSLSPEKKTRRIALIGLRGAGKTTLGPLLAKKLDAKFVELNDIVRQNGGMSVAEIFALYGQEGYRNLEKQALEDVARLKNDVVLAVGGGIVSEPATYKNLRANFHTVWLRANAQDHMDRVHAQGDDRPMAENPDAMTSLRSILRGREAQYAKADIQVNTSNVTVQQSLKNIFQQIETLS